MEIANVGIDFLAQVFGLATLVKIALNTGKVVQKLENQGEKLTHQDERIAKIEHFLFSNNIS